MLSLPAWPPVTLQPRTGALDLVLEALALAVIVAGVAALSHSHLIADEDVPPPPSGGLLANARTSDAWLS
jgi:hypothetical protein